MALKVGIQLFSVKNSMKKDPVATIGEVARIGYKCIETANHRADQDSGCGFGVSAAELKARISQYGSRIVSGHIFPMTETNIDAIIDYYTELGAEYLVDPMRVFKDRDEVLAMCEHFNKMGRRIHEAGMRFCYHNHFHEFQKMDGDRNVLELILENTDPDYVGFELDTYWAMRGGADPVQLIRKYSDRICVLHQKDLAVDYDKPLNHLEKCGDVYIDHKVFAETVGDRHSIVEIGTGCMDIQSIIDAANATGNIKYIILEQDATRYDEMESIKISMDTFRKFSGIEWE